MNCVTYDKDFFLKSITEQYLMSSEALVMSSYLVSLEMKLSIKMSEEGNVK